MNLFKLTVGRTAWIACLLLLWFTSTSLAQTRDKERTSTEVQSNAQKTTSTDSDDEDPQFKGMKYRLVGPFRGGRSLTASGVAGDPNTYYFGSTGGGVWKSTDGAMTWTSVFDKETVLLDWKPGGCALGSKRRVCRNRRSMHPRQHLAGRWDLQNRRWGKDLEKCRLA
ncbi:MAG: hypothetical protein WB558_22480 [Terriglobales bacterium]